MYVKVITDTLKLHLNRSYAKWAETCPNEPLKFAGYNIYNTSGEIIDATLAARDSFPYFNENLAIIGKSKSGPLALDYSGNLYHCGRTLKRLDRSISEFIQRQSVEVHT